MAATTMSPGSTTVPGGPPKGPPPAIPFGPRLATGLFGIFLGAMLAGLNNRVGSLGLADIRGQIGASLDQASWLTTAYSAGEIVAMPFSTWFAITFSMRRFHLSALGLSVLIAILLPFAPNLQTMIALRALQGMASGALIPVLMMAALRFLPPPIKLHGLALYSMTATFAPNVAMWLAGQWTDTMFEWRLIYWQIVPLGLLAGTLVWWGIPRMPLQPQRLGTANWTGLLLGLVGLSSLAIGLDQAGRLDWFASPLIRFMLSLGTGATLLFLISEWFHPAPFIKLQLLGRRNLGLGFSIFFGVLVAMMAGSMLPAAYLGHLWLYKPGQSAMIGTLVGLPQLILAPAVSLLLYRKWADARLVLACGLALMAFSCFVCLPISSDWISDQFIKAQLMQAIGQPMAVVSLLFLGTGVVHPMEGPYVSGIINTLRAFGTLFGSAIVSHFIEVRERFHFDMLLNSVGDHRLAPAIDGAAISTFSQLVTGEAAVMATADAYLLLGWLSLFLAPLALFLMYVAPPTSTKPIPEVK